MLTVYRRLILGRRYRNTNLTVQIAICYHTNIGKKKKGLKNNRPMDSISAMSWKQLQIVLFNLNTATV